MKTAKPKLRNVPPSDQQVHFNHVENGKIQEKLKTCPRERTPRSRLRDRGTLPGTDGDTRRDVGAQSDAGGGSSLGDSLPQLHCLVLK